MSYQKFYFNRNSNSSIEEKIEKIIGRVYFYRRDVLKGIVKAAKSLASANSLAGNPWVNHVNERYQAITNSLRIPDVSDKLKELKNIRRLYSDKISL